MYWIDRLSTHIIVMHKYIQTCQVAVPQYVNDLGCDAGKNAYDLSSGLVIIARDKRVDAEQNTTIWRRG